MEDNSYTIRARIVAEDATGPGTTTAKKKIVEVEEQARKTSSNLMGLFGRAFAFLGGAAGFGMAARGVVGLNSEIEQARSGLAGLFTAQTGLPIADSLKIARSELSLLRKDAATGVGELGDYLTTYQGVVGVALPLGANVDQMRALTRNALAAGFAMQGNRGLQNAGLDIQQAMGGQVGDRTTPIVMAALRAAGITAEEFRKVDPSKRIDVLNEAFGRFAPAVELMGKSWDAQFSTLKDNTKELLRTATSPLFEVWSEKLRAANGWLAANKDRVEEIATVAGQRLVKLWDHLIRQAGTYAAIVAGATLVQPASSVAAGGGSFLSKLLEGAKWGAALPGRAGFLGRAGGAAAGGAGEVLAMLPALGSSLATLAAPVALLAAGFLAVQGAIFEYPETLAFIASRGDMLMETLGRLGDAFGRLNQKGSALNIVGGALIGSLGIVATVLDYGLLRPLATLVEVLGMVFAQMGGALRAIGYAATGDFGKAADALVGNIDATSNAAKNIAAIWGGGATGGPTRAGPGWGNMADRDRDTTPKLPVKKGGDVNINGPVTLQVKTEVNADPARVMQAFDEGVSRLNLYRRQAARLPALP